MVPSNQAEVTCVPSSPLGFAIGATAAAESVLSATLLTSTSSKPTRVFTVRCAAAMLSTSVTCMGPHCAPLRDCAVPRHLNAIWCVSVRVGRSCTRDCVRTVSHSPGNPGQTRGFTGTRQRISMLREVVDRNCVGGIWCASARATGIYFQACSFNHSDISPL